MLTDDELYRGFPKEKAEAYRREAVEKWGQEAVEESEAKLRRMDKPNFERLAAEAQEIGHTLAGLMHLDPADGTVQQHVARHYANIQQFWGDSVGQNGQMAEAYKGLGQLYVSDLRYTASYTGEENPAFAEFMSKAMAHFADTRLNA